MQTPIYEEISEILKICGNSIREIFIFGSRVNGNSTKDSDWDILIFGDEYCLKTLQTKDGLKFSESMDIFVVYNGNKFCNPYNDKKGSLSGWGWVEYDGECFYRPSFKHGNTVVGLSRAVRIWKPSIGFLEIELEN